MLRKYRRQRKFAFLIILFPLTLLACIITDILPDPCSTSWLIGKINLANMDPGTYTINLDPGCIYEFDAIDNSFPYGDNALPIISTPIVINGNGATIQRSAAAGTPEFRFFFIDANGSLTLEDVTVTNGNTGSAWDIYSSGGAILSHEGSLTINDSAITDNFSSAPGGAIVVIRNNLTITGSTFSGNENIDDGVSWYGGGAVAVHEGAPMTITGSEFTNNLSNNGGAIYAFETYSTITGCTFTNNSEHAISVDGSELTITDSNFTSNNAFTGGAIIFSGTYIDGGAVIYVENDFTITGSTFNHNQADTSGGAIFIRNVANLTINESTFVGNEVMGQGPSDGEGSAITILAFGNPVSRNVSIYESTFTGNVANGAAVIYDVPAAIFNLPGSNISIEKSTFANNIGSHGLGGIWSSGDISIENSTFSGNSGNCYNWSDGGCGIAIHSTGSADIYYSTIANNGGPFSAAAVFSEGGSVRIGGSIIANNISGDCGSSDGGFLGSYGISLDSDGSCISLIQADPLIYPLAFNGGPTQTHALQLGSPAIDAGRTRCLADDQRSVSRPIGFGCDLGAYELSFALLSPPTLFFSCEGILGISVREGNMIRIQLSTPGLPDGTYDATADDYNFTCKTYPEYPGRLFCDMPRGAPGTYTTLIIFDPLGLPFCEQTFGNPSRDVSEEPEESVDCSKYTTYTTCTADPRCDWPTRAGPCVEK